jgi:hypothetical protein
VVHVGHADADAAAEGPCDLRLGRIEKSAGRRAETEACEAGKGDENVKKCQMAACRGRCAVEVADFDLFLDCYCTDNSLIIFV